MKNDRCMIESLLEINRPLKIHQKRYKKLDAERKEILKAAALNLAFATIGFLICMYISARNQEVERLIFL